MAHATKGRKHTTTSDVIARSSNILLGAEITPVLKSIASNWVILVFGKYLSKHWYLNVLSHLLMHNTTKRHYQSILDLLKADLFKQRHWNASQREFFGKREIVAHTVAIHCQ